MTVVQSLGAFVSVQRDWWPTGVNRSSVRMYDTYYQDYATLYRTQPNVRTCIDFLARNIAQLGLHVYRRVSETDRVRLRDHPLALLLAQPLPPEFKMTRYRLIEFLVSDMGIYFNAYWLKVRRPDGSGLSLLRIPPPCVEVKGGLAPTGYTLTLAGRPPLQVAPGDMVHFRGYNPENPVSGLSLLETLRRVLAEEDAAGDYREGFWQSAARIGGVIERPASAPEWSEGARSRFKQEFSEHHAGQHGSGTTPVLEEGMTWRATSFNAQESEYLDGRKRTSEECARANHIPLPMVGILEHATFSNIREQHKNLYQDSLGPWLAMVEQDIELQLLPEFDDTAGVYVEFNIAEKMQGDFEDQTKALQSSVGRAWMTPDEARARMNLPSLSGDAAQLGTPLNVLIGGQASPRDSAPKYALQGKGTKAAGRLDPTQPALREKWREQWSTLMARTFERQRAAVLSRVKQAPDAAALWDADRWNRELGADFFRLGAATASDFAGVVGQALEFEPDTDEMLPWLEENARVAAEYVNATTFEELQAALQDEDTRGALERMFELALGVRAARVALGRVTATANFGAYNAARQGGMTQKTWQTNSGNPRASHAALNGTTIPLREPFGNGLMWPGDPSGSAEENANCECSVTFGREE
jgi:HK97 family phage portal protein